VIDFSSIQHLLMSD